MELQWHVNQNKIAIGFLKMTFYSLTESNKFTARKSIFSVIASKSLKFSFV